jgi:hypothetical protein
VSLRQFTAAMVYDLRDPARRRRQYVAQWYAFHANMADCHARLSEEHRTKAEALLEDRGVGVS